VHGTDRVARVTVGTTGTLTLIQPDEATFFLYDHLGNTRVPKRNFFEVIESD
jgi:hypothetical protein